MKVICSLLLAFVLLLSACPVPAESGLRGTSNYIYDENEKTVPVPPAYAHEKTWMASMIDGVDSLRGMQSACVKNGKIYISLTTGILIFDAQFNLLNNLTCYTDLEGHKVDFDSNAGICAIENGDYYVCEPNRSRILHFNKDNELVRLMDNPGIIGVDAGVKYRPTNLAVDDAGRMFVVAKGMYEGIVQLNADGTFANFYGVNEVSFTMWDLIWRKLATETQRAKQSLWLPTDFTNLCIDPDGFIFATVQSTSAADPIMRLNAKGENILRVSEGDPYPYGDLWLNRKTSVGAPVGPSEFTAVDVNDFGVFIVLDNVRSRVFAYNEDGKLLFVFGGPGNREGQFRGAVDVDFLDEKIVVLDSTAETIEVFSVTDYGRALMKAVNAQYDFDYQVAEDYWREALEYNHNLFIAYSGIGRAMLRRGEAEGALEFLKLGADRKYYSKALEKVRNEKLKTYLVPTVGTLAGIWVALKCVKLIWRKARRKGGRTV